MTDTTANRAGTIDLASIDISLEDSKPVERPFPGTIVIDAFEDGRVYGPGDSGVTWHLAVKAVGAEKPFHAWLPLKYASEKEDGIVVYLDGNDGRALKYSMAGGFGRVLNSIREQVGGKDTDGNARKPGHGELNGINAQWVLRVLTYGKDPTTGELRGANGRPTLIAVGKATGQDMAKAEGAVGGTPAIEYTPADISAALDLLDGKKPLEYQRAVMKAPISAELKGAILQGTAAAYLVANGFATQDGSVIVRTQEVVAA